MWLFCCAWAVLTPGTKFAFPVSLFVEFVEEFLGCEEGKVFVVGEWEWLDEAVADGVDLGVAGVGTVDVDF